MVGEDLVDKYAWAIPDETSLRVIQHFARLCSGVTEVGCGANAYWGKILLGKGVDYRGYDIDVERGGKLLSANAGGNAATKKGKGGAAATNDFRPRKGGAEVLKLKENKGRLLFLCFPDEDVQAEADNDSGEDGKKKKKKSGAAKNPPVPLSVQCLSNFTGDYIVHVGELFGSNISSSQSPFGRSTSAEFQCLLHSSFHCILRHALPSWPHAKEQITVWKRNVPCVFEFAADSDDEDDAGDNEDEIYYHIPRDEVLPVDAASDCCKFLLEERTQEKQAGGGGKAAASSEGNSSTKTTKGKLEAGGSGEGGGKRLKA